ncbi:hypothetical protein ACFOLF_34380 [Paenibacillus sepulcri]|uniref:Uncharacterized protein n=1 Tax=Paenibacillus sepulcri TaxID=359917 RepID=A0ABS7CC62_9BACL|nr:hypothetical protein [Paenibacillus sepulcri]
MKITKSFVLVVVNLIGDLWLGTMRKPEFYDKQTAAVRTRLGYAGFVAAAALMAAGAVTWLCLRIY